LNKFERISNQTVSLPLRGSQCCAAPPSLRQGFGGQAIRRASEKVGSNIPLKSGKRKTQKF
jgi:hypothetical protein